MRNMKRALAFLLVLFMLVQASPVTLVAVAVSGQPSKYSDAYNSGQRDVVATTLNGTGANAYYTGSYAYDSLSKQSASSIQSALKTLMTSTHKKKSSYDDCHYMADQTDCENENGKISLIYTKYTATMSQWNGWNREHVWPKSLGGDTTSGGGADLHHIRPSDAVVNSTRGNKKYGNVSGGTSVYGKNPATGYLGGTYDTYFEPNDNVKGDVARICLYVYVRWGSDWSATSITKVFQSVDVLLEWCEMDPVDTWELGRNEVVEAYQGNRNVFIDYPEYAWLIFGEAVPTDMTTPSGKASSGTTTPPVTEPPTTNPPATEPTVTEPPVTEPPATEPPVDLPDNTDGFKEAVALVSTKTGNDQFSAICQAMAIYDTLSAADKASVAAEYQQLIDAATAYNQITQQLNADIESERHSILSPASITVSVISFAALTLLSKKYF